MKSPKTIAPLNESGMPGILTWNIDARLAVWCGETLSRSQGFKGIARNVRTKMKAKIQLYILDIQIWLLVLASRLVYWTMTSKDKEWVDQNYPNEIDNNK